VLQQFAWLEPVAWGAAVIGLIVAYLAVRAAHLQRRRQFETIYVQRYWALMDQLSIEALKGNPRPTISLADQRVIRSYLRLCEDELELRQEGWISRETWAIWKTGITAQTKRWPFQAVWQEVDRETGPRRSNTDIPEEFTLLRKFLCDGKDPKSMYSRWKRCWRFTCRLLTGSP
jgi:hypothetical protein